VGSFTKTDKQKEAISVIANNRHTALFGGSRSGKSAIAVFSIIVRAVKTQSRHAIIRNTFNSVKRSIFMDTMPKVLQMAFPDLPVRWNKSDYYITLPNNSEIWFFGLDDSRADRILGMEFSTILFDEASELNYAPIQTAISRLAEKNSLTKRIIYTFNPPSKIHWSYYLFIKGLNPADDEPLEDAENYGTLLMNPKDNIENIDEEYLKILSKMPKKERERFLEGKFADSSDGQVYYEFDPDKHVGDTHIIQGTKYIFMDFNVSPMTACLAQVINNEIHVHDEVYLDNSDTFKMVKELKKRNYIGIVIPDSTGKNRKTSGLSDFQILTESGLKIDSVHNPIVFDRCNNVNRLFVSDQIKINKKCKKLINDLHKVSWKDNKLDQKTDRMLTHISDALGYGCWRLFPIMHNTWETPKGIR